MLKLYGTEWCPFTSAVRERLTELGVAYVAEPVEPYPDEREAMREAVGTDEIPVLVLDDGEVVAGTKAILRRLGERDHDGGPAHRERWVEHAHNRDAVASELLDRAAPTDG